MISHGHRRDDILEYTIDEFELYSKATDQAERAKLAALAPIIYVATQGDHKSLTKIIEQLTES